MFSRAGLAGACTKGTPAVKQRRIATLFYASVPPALFHNCQTLESIGHKCAATDSFTSGLIVLVFGSPGRHVDLAGIPLISSGLHRTSGNVEERGTGSLRLTTNTAQATILPPTLRGTDGDERRQGCGVNVVGEGETNRKAEAEDRDMVNCVGPCIGT